MIEFTKIKIDSSSRGDLIGTLEEIINRISDFDDEPASGGESRGNGNRYYFDVTKRTEENKDDLDSMQIMTEEELDEYLRK